MANSIWIKHIPGIVLFGLKLVPVDYKYCRVGE